MRSPSCSERLERPDGCTIEYRVYNTGASHTVILSNGIGCNEVFFRHLIDDLACDHRVVTWDYRAHGGSSVSAQRAGYSVSAHAADLAAVQDAARSPVAAHFGFAMGAVVVLELYRRRPELASALVLLQGGLRPAALSLSPMRRLARWGIDAASSLSPVGARLVRRVAGSGLVHPVARGLGLLGPTCDREDFATFLEFVRALDVGAYLEIAGQLVDHDVSPVLDGVAVPCLIFGATRDLFYPEALMRRAHDRIAGSEYSRLEGASHACLLEVGPVISARTRRFLSERVER